MINNVVLVGRVTKELEIKKTQNDKSYCGFTLAINDRFNKEHTDFVNCVSWGASADYLGKYASKGDVVGVNGRISTRSYEKDGIKRFVTEITCESVQIISSKKSDTDGQVEEPNMNVGSGSVDISSDDLPFY